MICDKEPEGPSFLSEGTKKGSREASLLGYGGTRSHSCHVSHLLFEEMGDELVEAAAPGEELMAGAG